MNLNFSFRRSLSLSLFFAQSLIVEAQEIPIVNSGLWLKIQSATATARDFILDSIPNLPPAFMGSTPVSSEVETEIHQILRDIKCKHADTIRIMRLSKFAMNYKIGSKNAIAFGVIGLPKFLFIDEDWYKTLSNDEKKYLIGHEVGHLKYYHLETKMAFGFLLGALYQGLILPTIAGKMSPKTLSSWWINKALSSIFILYPILMLSRFTEYQADKSSVIDNNDVKGGISLLKKWNKHFEDIDSELPQWKIHKWIRWFVTEYFTTHPTCDSRIAYLKKLKKTLLQKSKSEEEMQISAA